MCSYFKFPDGCAGAVRHEKLAQMLVGMGHEVKVAGIGAANGFKWAEHKSIPYISLRYGSSFTQKVKTRLLYWRNFRRVLKDISPDAVLMDDMRPRVTKKLKRYSKKHNILLIHDSVEWYSKEQFKAGALAPQYIKKNRINRRIIDSSCRVIAISRYLQNHFLSRGIKCVNIPIVVSDEDLEKEKNLGEKLCFLYAGQAGRKDYLHIVLGAMALLDKEQRKKFSFRILGCSKQQLIDSGIEAKLLESLEDNLDIRGRVKRQEVLENLKTADFTILMRSAHQRYAKAGFPTKAVESLAHSTPVIANLTSDLGLYLADGENSLIVEECSAESLAKVLERAISLSGEERRRMCENAYNTAAEQLHYKKFITAMEEILK